MAQASLAGESALDLAAEAAGGQVRGRLLEIAAVAAALLAESLLLLAAEGRRIPIPMLAGGHLIVCVLLFQIVAYRARKRADTVPAMVGALLTAIAGPIGAALALPALWRIGRGRARSELLAGWYDRLALSQHTDDVQKLCDSVAIGRALDLLAPPPHSFGAVVTSGTIAEQQTALGLIARKFSPDYAPALHAALKSEEPVIRVQAAAVAARVREGLEKNLAEQLRLADASQLAPLAALRLATRIKGTIASGLLDEGTRARAEATVRRLFTRQIADQPTALNLIELAGILRGVHMSAGPAEAKRMAVAIESELAQSARFATLRALRRVGRIWPHPRYRLRSRRPASGHASGEAR